MSYKSLANTITLANLFCGFLAVLFSIGGQYTIAAWMIIIALGFDVIDGQVARRCQITSCLGQELDSLSDFISFGVAPVILLYMINSQALGITFAPLAIYLFCGAYRLARFNISSGLKPNSFFEGLPIPAAGSMIASAFLMLKKINLGFNPALFLILAMILALLMVSCIKYPTFKEAKINAKSLVILMAFLVGFIFRPQLTAFLLFLTYLILSPLKFRCQ